MPHALPKGLTRENVLEALADLDAGLEHPFGTPTGYELVHESRRYPPKAVIGLACRSLLGGVLLPEEFSGGEAPGQANFVLRELGFTVEKREHQELTSGGRDWSRDEVDLVVADYFQMLQSELLSESYSKAAHNRELRPLLDRRSKSSIEFKHQNISAVLVSFGLPYIDGYKPARNYQRAVLPEAVDAYLIRHPQLLETLAQGRVVNPTSAPTVRNGPIEKYFEGRPNCVTVRPEDDKPWLSRRGIRLDFARRDAANRAMGRLGEEFAIAVEKRRLRSFERDDLAMKVEWVAEKHGDGVGFDVLSFDENDDSERYIEVKTTGLGKHFPFYVTANEVRCSEDCPERFRLYRVFDFARHPRLYVVAGALSRECRLVPGTYLAAPLKSSDANP
jgi:hypothetical protein